MMETPKARDAEVDPKTHGVEPPETNLEDQHHLERSQE